MYVLPAAAPGAARGAATTALVTDDAVGGARGDVAVATDDVITATDDVITKTDDVITATDDVIVLMSPRGSAHATVSAALGLSPAWSRDSRCSYADV